MLDGITQGLTTALTPVNLAMVLAGCLIGTLIGMIPGLGPITAIALMIPLTYELDPASALILMAGVYYGAVFGGSRIIRGLTLSLKQNDYVLAARAIGAGDRRIILSHILPNTMPIVIISVASPQEANSR